jgi:hypothetical protein
MLAPNHHKSPSDLKITNQEFTGLIAVLGMLERGELRYVTNERIWNKNARRIQGAIGGFNMDHTGIAAKCGTVGCIGGWLAVVNGAKAPFQMDRYVNVLRSGALEALFYPDREGDVISSYNYDHITAPQAAQAIRNFLMTGHPNWDEVLA